MSGRLALGVVGLVGVVHGAWLLWSTARPDQLVSAGLWLAGGVAIHDGLFAPVAILFGWWLMRALPAWARGPVASGAIVLAVLTVVAVPVLGRWGARPDNLSLLPRNYLLGWLLVAGVIAVVVLAAVLGARMRTGRTTESGT